MDLEAFRQMVAKTPRGFLGRYGLGNKILQEGGNLEEAVEHLRVAVELDPVICAHLALGRAWLPWGKLLRQSGTHAGTTVPISPLNAD